MPDIVFPDAGKIQQDFFSGAILPYCGRHRKEVSTGAAYGVDVAVVQLPGGMAMALTSDPLTLIPSLGLYESAWLSVHISANDMATTGHAPQYAQFVLNLPETLSAADFNTYWQYIHELCSKTGIAITGGHTGQVHGQNSTVAGGLTLVTVAEEKNILTSNLAKPGNRILVTKQYAMTASAILAMSFPETVTQKAGKEICDKACASFYHTSSLPDALVAVEKREQVTAMHDVTEGGVLGAIYEMALASGCGVEIQESHMPASEVQDAVCSVFHIDPLYVVGAGSMIMAVTEGTEDDVLQRLHQNGIPAVCVGHFTDKAQGLHITGRTGISKPLIHPGTDAYWNAFYQAFAQGWK